MKNPIIKKLAGLLYAAIIIALMCLFFTNDFWLVDLRKTSVVIGIGIDRGEEGITLTAQLAVPKATENGGDVQFACVSGEGGTVAAALRDVNSKTGFYPKLVFCKLIVLGESCFDGDIFSCLDYFYRNEYTGLTPRVAACKGEASEVFSVKLPFGDSATDAIDRLLSEEAQRAGVAVSVDLRDVGLSRGEEGRAVVMPYIEHNGSGTVQGDTQSGESSSNSGSSDDAVFSCGKTACFKDGEFKGVLDEKLTLALNLLTGDVRHVFVECNENDKTTVLGLRSCKGGIKANAEGAKLSFSAVAQVQDEIERNGQKEENYNSLKDSTGAIDKKASFTSRASAEITKLGEDTVKELIEELIAKSRQLSCDFLSVGSALYKASPDYLSQHRETYLSDLPFEITVDIASSG